ncbi:hypothetical protein BOTBODRAFT_27605 [Botryobasidium botryosum FD-172 SS1]|uniref:Uncharacterized protein n=1 Tax=Botryobasidium botryosum (strain FD-172 SS1) TaxID=930990 RepID=A0A067N8S8_BOTB1|nr:hypothetical protein BOTBODRAFT_27605 [Botryobasidium botryosum FD-172 SS1]
MPPVGDIVHRTVVVALASLSVYGLYLGGSVHMHTLREGRRLEALHQEEQARLRQQEQLTPAEQEELRFAKAAQDNLRNPSQPTA